MYFIGVASPAPPQIYDPHYVGLYLRPDERRGAADVYADKARRGEKLPLVMNHGRKLLAEARLAIPPTP